MDRYRLLPTYYYKNSEDGLLSKSVGKPLKDYKIYGNLALDGLPIEYQMVEYIESTGTQYIKTGACPAINPGFDITFLTKDSLSTSGYGCIFGARPGNKYNEFQLSTFSEGQNTGMLRFAEHEYNAGLVASEKMTATLINNIYSNSNGAEATMGGAGVTTPDQQITVFALNSKIYSGSIVVRNFIPCYRKSDGEIGLYDTIRQRFYTNDGTGTFLRGDDVYQPPTTPMILTSVGDNIGNIFDYDTVTIDWQTSKIEIDEEKCYQSKSIEGDYWAIFRTDMSGMEDGKQYTISFDIWADIEAKFTGKEAQINNQTRPSHGLTVVTNEKQNVTTTFTYKANTGADILHLYIQYIAENVMYISNVSIVPCEPYRIPITTHSKNISEFHDENMSNGGLTGVITPDTIEFDGDGSNDGRCLTSNSVTLPAGTYVITMQQESGSDSMTDTYETFYMYKKGSWTILTSLFLPNTGKNSTIFDVAEDTEVQLGIYIRGLQVFHNYKARYQILKGHTVDFDFETNKGSVTEDICLSKPLSKCGDYADYIDFKNQKVVWNTDEYVLDGTEEWQNLYGESLFGCNSLFQNEGVQPMLSTHYIYNSIQSGLNAGLPNGEFAYQTKDKNLYFKDTRFTTVGEWKSWLAEQYASGKPVVVRYTLATPVEESIALPKLLTNIDSCVAEVDSSIPPSKTKYQYYNFSLFSAHGLRNLGNIPFSWQSP